MQKRTVEILRTENKTNLPDDLYQLAKKKIGSTFIKGTTIPVKGLSQEEIKEYMPIVLGMSPDDIKFNEAVNRYFHDITTEIPPAGKPLDISVDESGNPVNIQDFIRYKHAVATSYVANSKEEADKQSGNEEFDASVNYTFYIKDPLQVRKARKKKAQSHQQALSVYLEVTSDEEKANWVIDCYGKNHNKMDKDDILPTLKEYFDDDPDTFVRIAKDENLETQSLIKRALSYNIITKEGNTYFFMDEPLGTEIEAINHLRNKNNSSDLLKIKSQLDEQDGVRTEQVEPEPEEPETKDSEEEDDVED